MQWQDVSSRVFDFIVEQQLPDDFKALSEKFYFPLAQQLLARRQRAKPLLLGINGAQGTGKSTLAALLGCILCHGAGWRCALLSIDDLYLTRRERETLARVIHPLLKVRGVPGTHDINLGISLLKQLVAPHGQSPIALPRFDKALDDRRPPEQWHTQVLPVDIVILEGWCVGTTAQADENLRIPINDLERRYDVSGEWRSYVNTQLAEVYQPFFAQLDLLVMLKAPSVESIEKWRWLQEQKLIVATSGKGEGLMDQTEIKRFIQHYERLTRHMLNEMPARADLVFHLDETHNITATSGPMAGEKPACS